MLDKKLRILIIEDVRTDAELVVYRLQRKGFSFEYDLIETKQQMRDHLSKAEYDLVISDYNLPEFDGIEALQIAREYNIDLPFILLSGSIDQQQETQLLQLGADEVIMKSNLNRLPFSVRRIQFEQIRKNELKSTKNELEESEKKFRRLFEYANDGILILSNGKLVDCNREVSRIFECTREEILGKTPFDFSPEYQEDGRTSQEKGLKLIDKAFSGESQIFEWQHLTAAGNIVHTEVSLSRVRLDEKESYLMAILRDLTEQKKREEVIRKALKEKEILLSEVHHRVKNNLAIISGLMQLKRMELADDRLEHILTDLLLKIRSIALVHETLYKSHDFANVDMPSFVDDLISYTEEIITDQNVKFEFASDISPMRLNVNQAVPCGLIISELVHNAAAHAFNDKGAKGDCRIEVSAKEEDGKVKLMISDTGSGLPDGFAFESGKGMGSKIVTTLFRQLEAEYEVANNDGAEITFAFERRQMRGSQSNMGLE